MLYETVFGFLFDNALCCIIYAMLCCAWGSTQSIQNTTLRYALSFIIFILAYPVLHIGGMEIEYPLSPVLIPLGGYAIMLLIFGVQIL